MRCALLIAVLTLSLATVQAKYSPECPNGCIIATVLSPARKCECVVPNCDWKQQLFGSASKPVDPREMAKLALSMGGLDCKFCERDSFTYSSYEECYAAALAFKPIGPSIDKKSYASLTSRQNKKKSMLNSGSEAVVTVAAAGVDDATAIAAPAVAAGESEEIDAAWVELFGAHDDGGGSDVDVYAAAVVTCPPPTVAGCPVSSPNSW